MAHPPVALRRATEQDVPALQALTRSPAVARFLSYTAAESYATGIADALVVEVDGRLAGGARLTVTNARSRITTIHGVMLDPAVRGRGLGTAVLRELAARAFAAGAHRVQAEVLGYNEAALRAFASAGFTREGVRRSAYDREGGWADGVHFGLLADEWRS